MGLATPRTALSTLAGRSSTPSRLRGTSDGSTGMASAASAVVTFAQNRAGLRSPSSSVSQATRRGRAAATAQVAQAMVLPELARALTTVTG